jgi:hypothetical protein
LLQGVSQIVAVGLGYSNKDKIRTEIIAEIFDEENIQNTIETYHNQEKEVQIIYKILQSLRIYNG